MWHRRPENEPRLIPCEMTDLLCISKHIEGELHGYDNAVLVDSESRSFGQGGSQIYAMIFAGVRKVHQNPSNTGVLRGLVIERRVVILRHGALLRRLLHLRLRLKLLFSRECCLVI